MQKKRNDMNVNRNRNTGRSGSRNNNRKRVERKDALLNEFLMDEDRMFDDEDDDDVTDDTLEFLCLDDETIASYERERQKASGRNASAGRRDEYEEEEVYEDEDYGDEDYEDEDYGDEDYEDEDYEDEDYGDEDYEDEDYGDEDYEDEDYEDEDYEDEDYEDEDYEDEDYDYEDDDDGIVARFMDFVTDMSAMDVLVAMLGIVVLAGVLITGGLYINAKSVEKQVAQFASVGEEIEGVSVIGESGLIAVAESAKLGSMIDMEEEQEAEEAENDKEEDEKEEADKTVQVTLNLTSIQSDLKIKFVNKATGKLIGGVPFEVEVSGGKKSFELKDEDKDGIIYQTGVAAGTYSVKIKPFEGEQYKEYKLPAEASSVKVVDTISYKKVDVADEVKTEAEVNAAAEDTAAQNTVVESVLKDTVEWVESTKTPVGEGKDAYEEVDKKNIPDPWKVSSIYRKMVEEGDGAGDEEDKGDDETGGGADSEPGDVDNPTVSLNTESLSLTKGESGSLKVSVSGTSSRYTVNWSSGDSSVATVSDGSVSAVGVGSTTITASVEVGSLLQDLTCAVTVSEPEEDKKDEQQPDDDKKDEDKDDDKDDDDEEDQDDEEQEDVIYTKVTISGDKEVAVGKTITLTAKTDPKGGKVKWSSENEKIAKVDSKGVVTGIAAGEVKIKAVCSNEQADDVAETCKITVKEQIDGGAKLKDKDGNQLYYLNSSGEYKEATYDDYNKRDKFFKKTKQVSEYKYTGWQTIDGHVYFYDKEGNYVTGEQVIQGAKYTFGSDGKMSSNSGTMGIDVSKWNGSIDWNAVKNSGVSYVIIRCGYRGSSTGVLVEDPKFRSNIKGAKAAGLKVGVYFFSQAVNEVEAVEEASMALNLVNGYGLNYPIFLDVEASGGRGDGISKDTRTAICKAFCATVQNSGYSAGIYANKTWFTEKINTGSLTGYKIWLAQYASAPTYKATRYDMWQYSSKGKVSGIKGDVDMNISYMSY